LGYIGLIKSQCPYFTFYGFIGLVVLFLIIAYAVSVGIDNSKQVKA